MSASNSPRTTPAPRATRPTLKRSPTVGKGKARSVAAAQPEAVVPRSILLHKLRGPSVEERRARLEGARVSLRHVPSGTHGVMNPTRKFKPKTSFDQAKYDFKNRSTPSESHSSSAAAAAAESAGSVRESQELAHLYNKVNTAVKLLDRLHSGKYEATGLPDGPFLRLIPQDDDSDDTESTIECSQEDRDDYDGSAPQAASGGGKAAAAAETDSDDDSADDLTNNFKNKVLADLIKLHQQHPDEDYISLQLGRFVRKEHQFKDSRRILARVGLESTYQVAANIQF